VNTALIVVAALVAAYLAFAAFIWRYQERIAFQPPLMPEGPPAHGLERLSFASGDGTMLVAYIVGEHRTGRPVVIAFHGNAVVARTVIPWTVEAAQRLDACCVLAEYRGYDGLEGTPSYTASALDAQATLRAASQHLKVPIGEVVLYGHSIGSAVAAELAAVAGPRALVLESPFTSARDMAARWRIVGLRFGWSLISRVHYDTVARVRELDVPVFVVHGERDRLIPAWMGRKVFAAAKRPGRLLIVETAGHSDVPDVGGNEYWSWLREAIQAGRPGQTFSS
jgi:fermentation-respiration switch protein FrsA (DUF1100 family)